MAHEWDRQPGEPERWFLRFDVYRRMGNGRNIEAVWRLENDGGRRQTTAKAPSSTWYQQAERWHWKERVSAWDNYIRAEDEREWAERRAQIRQDDWAMATALREKAKQMLMFPVTKVTKNEEGNMTIIEPAGWSFADAAKIVDLASKLARLAAGMDEASRQEPQNVITWSPEQWKQEAAERRRQAQEAIMLAQETPAAPAADEGRGSA